jgi:hypothetical protein
MILSRHLLSRMAAFWIQNTAMRDSGNIASTTIRFLDIVFSTSVDREGDKNEIATWHCARVACQYVLVRVNRCAVIS